MFTPLNISLEISEANLTGELQAFICYKLMKTMKTNPELTEQRNAYKKRILSG